MPKVLALDTETTGLDLYHDAMPYFVTTCDDKDNQLYWHWRVCPATRQPIVPRQDLIEIQRLIDAAKIVVLQNAKFDYHALRNVFEANHVKFRWDWSKVRDTLLSGHLLSSLNRHDLSTMSLVYLGIDIDGYNEALKDACQKARRIAKKEFPKWKIAEAGLKGMPSAKGSVWKYDAWLPRQIAEASEYPPDHEWFTVLENYANMDSAATIRLYKKHLRKMKERKLLAIYRERLKLLPIVVDMEDFGVTYSESRLNELLGEYQNQSAALNDDCVSLSKSIGSEVTLPKSGTNTSLLEFGEKYLEPFMGIVDASGFVGSGAKGKDVAKRKNIRTPTGKLRMGRADLLACLEAAKVLSEDQRIPRFLESLLEKRRRDTAITYMNSYVKFSLPKKRDARVLHPSLNTTGTNTLRWSSSNPNEQNISKQEGFNLRYCFGPAKGREWWSLDANNIELRIPAYEAEEDEMIVLFEKPDEPPYFGSNHLLVFDILWTKRLKLDTSDPEYLLKAKKKYASTNYQWTKNGNFAVQYGAVPESGTADRAYHKAGAQELVQARFAKMKKLNDRMVEHATKYGYVETIPDKTVDPSRGYPLECERQYGRVKPTVPLNYHVQGTAMWWMMKAMIRCYNYLTDLSRRRRKEYKMIMQVHDEIVFDFPYRPDKRNLSIVKKVAKLMEEGGNDIGIPTPVSIEYHKNNWSE